MANNKEQIAKDLMGKTYGDFWQYKQTHENIQFIIVSYNNIRTDDGNDVLKLNEVYVEFVGPTSFLTQDSIITYVY